jgi:phosphoglucosamine mutase
MMALPQVLVNVRVQRRDHDIATTLADTIAAAERRLGDRGRVFVRASGTEPLIRVMVEAPTEAEARSVAEDVAEAARKASGSAH